MSALRGVAEPATCDATRWRPLELHTRAPLPALLRVYLFTITAPIAERQEGACRIQITLPGQSRQAGGKRPRAHFDWSDDAYVALVGYYPSLDVYAMWDASLYEDPAGIPFSRNCQVLASTLYRALSDDVAEQSRDLIKGGEQELVVTCARAALARGLARRVDLTWRRLERRTDPGSQR